MDGVNHEIDFDGDWKPDTDEILTIDAPPDASLIVAEAAKTVATIPHVDANALSTSFIKGLFVKQPNGRILVQCFASQQLLTNKHAFWLSGNTFEEIEAPSFAIASHLTAVIEGNEIKFKNFPVLKRILDMSALYQEATDVQIEDFCAHAKLSVANVDDIKEAAGPALRRRIHAVAQTGVLDTYSVKQLTTRAKTLKVPLTVQGNRLEMPSDKKELKNFLSFLEEKVYQGALTKKLYVANAKRPFQ